MLRLRTLALLLTPVLAVTACGSDSDSVDPAPYIAAVEADFQDNGGPEGEASTCLATALVDSVGADTLDDAGITPEEFAAAEDLQDFDLDLDEDAVERDLQASLGDCPVGEAFADLLLSEFPADIAGEDRQCVVDALNDNDDLSDSLAASFVEGDGGTGEAAFETALASSLADCPQVLGDLIADSIDAAGVAVDDEARACIIAEVEAGGPAFVTAIVEGGAGSQQLGADIAAACLPDA